MIINALLEINERNFLNIFFINIYQMFDLCFN